MDGIVGVFGWLFQTRTGVLSLLGGGIVGIGTLVISVVIRLLKAHSDFFRNLRDD